MQAASVIKNSLRLLSCGSTQSVAAAIADSTSCECLVCSEYQSQGQGQQGRRWHARPGENLLFTLLLRPTFLTPQQLFMLNIIATLSLYDLLASLSVPKLYIKWPNDIYADHKKLAGILLTSKIAGRHIHYVLLGVGLNVNQKHFSLRQASSLMLLLGRSLDKELLLQDWLHSFAARYEQLRTQKNHQALRETYQTHLFARAQTHIYCQPAGTPFAATLLGIDACGRLQLKTDQGVQHFLPGTLQYLGKDQENS